MRPRQFATARADASYLTVDTGGHCIYCGERATEMDHFFPVSVAAALLELGITPKNLFLVPACGECNRFAGANVFETFEEKALFIKEKLQDKYWRLFSTPVWTAEELAELSPRFAQYIHRSLIQQEILKGRLEWPSNLNLENAYSVEGNFESAGAGRNTAERSASSDFIIYGGGSLSIADEKRKRERINREYRRNLIADLGKEAGLERYKEALEEKSW